MGYIDIDIDDQELRMVRVMDIYIYIYIYIAICTSYRAWYGWLWHDKREVVYKYGVGSLDAVEE